MSNVLLIVEGDKTEKEFFERFNIVKENKQFSIVPFKQNILHLFDVCTQYIFNKIKPDNIIDILREQLNNPSDEDIEKLNGKYTDVFLIFDLDLQNHRVKGQTIEEYLAKISLLIEFFNESTTIGQILINYPMMESFMHIDDPNFNSFKDFKVSFEVAESGCYTNYLNSFNMNFPVSLLKDSDFKLLSLNNLKKAQFVLNGKFEMPTSKMYEYELTQKEIFRKQVECLNAGFLYTLNCAAFVDIELNGKLIYFSNEYKNHFKPNEDFIIGHYKKLNRFKN